MLAGPQRSNKPKKFKKPVATRSRAQTDFQRKQTSNTTQQQQPKKAQDDLLDLFGSFATNEDIVNSSNDNSVNPFGDDFSDFVNTNTNNANKENVEIEKPKKKKKKNLKKKGRKRAKTATTKSSPIKKEEMNKREAPKTNVKMKKIDVLPLLHQGIRCNKFKLKGNKSKVRTFYLTESNFYFCWEAVKSGAQKEKKGLFGGKMSKSSRDKVDKDRSIPIRAIISIEKNSADSMKSLDFVPEAQKNLTLTIEYAANGQDKKLNFMAYEPFHHMLFYEGIQELINASRDPKRNLSEVFELYVDFPKEILPKHLRPQRFKWEPLGDTDFTKDSGDDKKQNDDHGSNMYFDSNPDSLTNVHVWDPTKAANYGRDRIKSF